MQTLVSKTQEISLDRTQAPPPSPNSSREKQQSERETLKVIKTQHIEAPGYRG